MFPFARVCNICCGHKFCVVWDTKNVSDFVQKHLMSATNVSQFAQLKKHRTGYYLSVLVYQGLNICQNMSERCILHAFSCFIQEIQWLVRESRRFGLYTGDSWLIQKSWHRCVHTVYSGRAQCHAVEYTIAFLYSNWLYFLWDGINSNDKPYYRKCLKCRSNETSYLTCNNILFKKNTKI